MLRLYVYSIRAQSAVLYVRSRSLFPKLLHHCLAEIDAKNA
ncbi:MAG: hypothetical protein V7K50_19750 [Nostoc sp.]